MAQGLRPTVDQLLAPEQIAAAQASQVRFTSCRGGWGARLARSRPQAPGPPLPPLT